MTKTLEGIYLGNQCGDMCYSAIKLSDGKDFGFMCGEDESESLFGEAGNKVSVTYELTQSFIEYNESERVCTRIPICKTGKILELKK
jgi:hypothetical protein